MDDMAGHDCLLGESLCTSHPSGLGLPQLQHSTKPNSRLSDVQYVCPSVRLNPRLLLGPSPLTMHSGSIISSNIYREDDAPRYQRGNSVLLSAVAFNIVLYFSTKAYYLYRNRQRERVWDRMTESERFTYLATTNDAGNKRLDFRFAS
jgi:hypothetical protein